MKPLNKLRAHRPYSTRRILLAAFLLVTCGHARAAVTITGNSTFNVPTNDYTYTYSVMNTGLTEDLAIVTIPVFSPLGVSSVIAPAGFLLTFDPSQRVVNFIEDGSILTPQTFAPGSTVGTFSFNSAVGPGFVPFLAYDATGTEFTGSAVAPIPEPAAALTSALALAGLLLRRRRSR